VAHSTAFVVPVWVPIRNHHPVAIFVTVNIDTAAVLIFKILFVLSEALLK
jgi:hypothetical protein